MFALTFRRGWTHGVLAWVLLPLALTAAMVCWDRWVRRARGPALPPASTGTLLALSVIGVWSHPLLDLLNVYGIRLLMPFSDRWFYGDVLFIVDPCLWLALAAGVLLARPRGSSRPARFALVAVGVYVGAMAVSMLAARALVRREMTAAGIGTQRIMVAPVPLNPFRRWVVVDGGAEYRVGDFDWLRWPPIRGDSLVNDRHAFESAPSYYTPTTYRYRRADRYYETNQYGADVLRQASNNGYQEGFLAGRADKQDNWRFDYKQSFAYQDANYGYDGRYVQQEDYNYYFREGFQRGYEDGYYERRQYGRSTGGANSLLDAVLGAILSLEALH